MAYRFRMAGHRSLRHLRLQERQAGKGSEQAADPALMRLAQLMVQERRLVVLMLLLQEPRLAD